MTRKVHFLPPQARGEFVHICRKCGTISVNLDVAVASYSGHCGEPQDRNATCAAILDVIAGSLASKGVFEATVLFFTEQQYQKMPAGMCRRNAWIAGLKRIGRDR